MQAQINGNYVCSKKDLQINNFRIQHGESIYQVAKDSLPFRSSEYHKIVRSL